MASAPNWTPWPLSCVSDVEGRKSRDLQCTVLPVGAHQETAAICNSSPNLSTSNPTGVLATEKNEIEAFLFLLASSN